MNIVMPFVLRERDIINTETGCLTEIEGSVITNEFIYPHSDVDIRVYCDNPSNVKKKWSIHTGLTPVCLECKTDLHSIYVFSYSKKFGTDIIIKFEVTFAPTHVRKKFQENEKNRSQNINRDKWISEKLKWYKKIEKETELCVRKNKMREFMKWKKNEIAKYKIHPLYYKLSK